MWTGAIKGFAWLKFSTSPSKLGKFEIKNIIDNVISKRGRESFTENKGLNLILSIFEWEAKGLEEPFSCSKIKWMITSRAIAIGSKKWSEKNRFKVGWETEGPPQSQTTKSFPTIGMAERTPVITVAPQKDICPQGRTYPRKAVAMVISMIMTPESQTFDLFLVEV